MALALALGTETEEGVDQGAEMAESLALDDSIVAKELEIGVVVEVVVGVGGGVVVSALGGVVGFFGNASTVVEAVVDIFWRWRDMVRAESGDGDGWQRRRAEGGARDW